MSLSGAAADEWIAGAARHGRSARARARASHRERRALSRRRSRRLGERICRATRPSEWRARPACRKARSRGSPTSFAQTQPGLAIGGGAAGNHTNGVDILIAVNVLNYLVGNLGAEGGRGVQPAAASSDAPQRQAGYRTMLELAQDARSGRIDVLIVSKTNPVFALPAAAGFREALAAHTADRQPVELHGRDDRARRSHSAQPHLSRKLGRRFPRARRRLSRRRDCAARGLAFVRHARERRHHPRSRATARSRRCAALERHGGLSASRVGARFISAARATTAPRASKRSGTRCLQAGVWGQDAHRDRGRASCRCRALIAGHRSRCAAVLRIEPMRIPSSCIRICPTLCMTAAARIFPGCRSCPIR